MIKTDITEIENRKFCWERKTFVIYSIVNLDNGKRYIGRTKNPRHRIASHFYNLKKHTHYNIQMNNESDCRFGYEILEEDVSWDDRRKEYEYMLLYKTNDDRYGYNGRDAYFTKNPWVKNRRKKTANQHEEV